MYILYTEKNVIIITVKYNLFTAQVFTIQLQKVSKSSAEIFILLQPCNELLNDY